MIAFEVVGEPVPQGSTRAFMAGGRPVVTHVNSSNLHNWRDVIGYAAREACDTLLLGPVEVTAVFSLTRPKSRPKRDLFPDRKPDLDKLARALLDSLTGTVVRDDAQVVGLRVKKRYARPDEQPGAMITVEESE